jgi:hypothetical protein
MGVAKEPRLSLIHALSTTLYFEQSLIESRFFEVFNEDSQNLRNLLSKHRVNQREHLERIRQLIAQHM